MVFDNNLILAGAVSATGVISGQAANGAGNILSTNTVDNGPLTTFGGNQVTDLGVGEPLEITITVVTAPTVGTSVQFQFIQADDAALTSNVQVINQTDAIPIASLPAGANVILHADRAAPFAPKRYVGLRFVNVGAIATASYFGAIVKNVQDKLLFKGGYGIV
jgi:hypothetical protein